MARGELYLSQRRLTTATLRPWFCTTTLRFQIRLNSARSTICNCAHGRCSTDPTRARPRASFVGGVMKKLVLSPPIFMGVLATRAALAFGVGLLVSEKMSKSQRRALGRTLIGIGVVTTIPALW